MSFAKGERVRVTQYGDETDTHTFGGERNTPVGHEGTVVRVADKVSGLIAVNLDEDATGIGIVEGEYRHVWMLHAAELMTLEVAD